MRSMGRYHTQGREGSQRLARAIRRWYAPPPAMANTVVGLDKMGERRGIEIELYVHFGKH
jgi:hypothetical protein